MRKRGRLHPSRFQIEQYFPPGLGRLAHAVLQREEMFLAAVVDSHDHQRAQPWIVPPYLLVHAVGIDVGEGPLGEIPLLPRLKARRPLPLERGDHARGELSGPLPENHLEHTGHVSLGDAFQIGICRPGRDG